VRGFFSTRFLSAGSADEAGNRALNLLRKDLVADPTSKSLPSAHLSLSEVEIIGFLTWLQGGKKGYTFSVEQ
jgi:hypothetical protein